jgi:hypothetical protein
MANKDEWQENRLEVLRGLKNPTEHQRLLLALTANPSPTPEDNRKLDALWKAERAEVRARDLRGAAAKIVDEEKKAARKARDHELYESAGLLILAGLVDTKTGKPTVNLAELLGALVGLAKVSADDPRRSEWKRAGESLLAERAKAKAKAKATDPTPGPEPVRQADTYQSGG